MLRRPGRGNLGEMMQFENPMTFVRSLKGAPASVLWALMFTRTMMTSLQLQQWTGYKDDNITLATRLLISLGWVVARSPRGPWSLAEGRQLPLMPGIETLANLQPDSDLIGVVPGVVDDVDSKVFSPSITTTTTSQMNPIKSDSLTSEQRACLNALKEAGVKGKKVMSLLKLDWLTVDYIRAHHSAVQCEDWDNPVGMLIYRIEGQEEPPVVAKKVEKSTRYSDGVFSDLMKGNSNDDASSSFEFKPLTWEDIKLSQRRINYGSCSRCNYVGNVVGTKDFDFCLTHFNEWRSETIGFNRR